MDEITGRLVSPFYLKVLHGNVVSPALAHERDGVLAQMRAVASSVTFSDALYLWPRGWRESLMASWWAAVWRWPEAVSQVERLLIPSRSCFEGQAHCLLLARVNSPQSRSVLASYLEEYLPRRDLEYDQPWAMAALTLACTAAGQPFPGRFRKAWSLWDATASPSRLDAYTGTVRRLIAFADAVASR